MVSIRKNCDDVTKTSLSSPSNKLDTLKKDKYLIRSKL